VQRWCSTIRRQVQTPERRCGRGELVLPIAIGNPYIDEVRVFRSPEGLAGVEGQTDGFAVEFRLVAVLNLPTPSDKREFVTFRSVPASTTADEKYCMFRAGNPNPC